MSYSIITAFFVVICCCTSLIQAEQQQYHLTANHNIMDLLSQFPDTSKLVSILVENSKIQTYLSSSGNS
jgi:hypothetical protein